MKNDFSGRENDLKKRSDFGWALPSLYRDKGREKERDKCSSEHKWKLCEVK